MKFQSSNAAVTPIQGYSNAYYRENMYIPSASARDLDAPTKKNDVYEEKDAFHDDDSECSGRITRYDTITMTSPVLSSARLVKRASKRYISDNDVNELNDKLQSLLLNTRNDEKEDDDDGEDEANTKTHSTKQSTSKAPVVELTKKEQATTTYFGRCSLVVYNSMTNNFVEVVRSARLAFTSS